MAHNFGWFSWNDYPEELYDLVLFLEQLYFNNKSAAKQKNFAFAKNNVL
ncbi:MAG: hypothetical protein WCX86_03375 [Candidatus Hydrogenedentales bacterium]